MKNISWVAFVLALLAGGVVSRNLSSGAAPKAGIEYRAIQRSDIEMLVPKRIEVESHHTEALSQGLNVLAGEGWELVAIEPYWSYQWKDVGTTVTYREGPTYILKRPR